MKIARYISCVLVAAALIMIGALGSAEATLIDRGAGLIYDSDRNITWLQDANYAMTSGYDADGKMTWDEAMTWVSDLVIYRAGEYLSDWRLPTAYNLDGSGPVFGYNVTGSEMGHLYYTELGNIADPPPNDPFYTGPFINLQDLPQSGYWSNTPYYPTTAWAFDFARGFQNTPNRLDSYFAWAVMEGDVTPVPEPGTMILLGSGILGAMGFRFRKKKS